MEQTKSGLVVEDIKGNQLYGILLTARGEQKSYPDTEILRKIRAAEDFYEKNLNIFLGIKRIKCGAHERGVAIDPNAAIPEIEEPGYDYDRDWYLGDKWGGFKLRNRPVVPDPNAPSGITQLFFAFPSAEQKLFNVPQQWLKVDFKNGQINVIPTNAAIYASFNAFFLSIASGGAYGLPKVIFVDYLAGYDPTRLRRDNADLLEGIMLRTLLFLGGIIGNVPFAGVGSTSIGLDGLSHSRGFAGGKYGRYSGQIQLAVEQEKEIRESFRAHEKSVIFVTV